MADAAAQAASFSDLPIELQTQILAAAVQGLRLNYISITTPKNRCFASCHNLRSYMHLRAVCSGWRSVLQSLPLPVRHLNISQAWPFPHLATAPLQVESLRLRVNKSLLDSAAGLLQSLLDSPTFRRHSAGSLVKIDAPAFTLSADSAAAFSQLTKIERLDARAMPPNLPSGVRCLAVEGDRKSLTRLDPAVFSHLSRPLHLKLLSVAVDVSRLPCNVWCVDLIRCEPGTAFNPALRAARSVPWEMKRLVWQEHHDGRLVAYCMAMTDWDADGRLAIEDAEPLGDTTNEVDHEGSDYGVQDYHWSLVQSIGVSMPWL